ncbi:hypothetical protein FoTM2_014067 [Fusarium oxysporum f. sp. vasinfectum]|uniref:Thiol-specific monooxygenase n=1 Tax=Fusarium oxysporum f. sp. vasinfectum 25433 TaxID=1089449 RepID=X0LBZ1_FUSOX|nr:hypothetical protein FOTG_13322 [Fusarium oxysporum f. sp. vasinfectum 25433]KAK2695723.1 hypothetical protein QWA68_003875 [Fusarium oxysporum]KAK2925701.1 hypothetical protein FoTM2_014067 [Fusarium oxysporum f. sp. vasinfectum]
MGDYNIKSVAVVGAGAAGAISAAALKAENYFDRIRVFERRETPGGTWIYDADPKVAPIQPGGFPADIDKPLAIPENLPTVTPPNQQERYAHTPIYQNLTTNVPQIAMSFSDQPFSYGPFVPHYVPRQYIETYFSTQKTDEYLSLNTTVEDVSQLPAATKGGLKPWRLTLRKYDSLRHLDVWWREDFDAVILANGHYAIPWVPHVQGLEAYTEKFPGKVIHSKFYRSPWIYANKRVVVIGNSASGHDIAVDLLQSVHQPLYQSRRSRGRLDGDEPPLGMEWKTVIKEYRLDGTIVFDDGSELKDIDHVIYCTGYLPSYPFWNSKLNGRPLFDYKKRKLINNYWHTFFQDIPNLAVVGMPRVLTFRSFEYQAIALARLFSGRNSISLPPKDEQKKWELDREKLCRQQGRKFHEIEWETGETFKWLEGFFQIAGLGTLSGEGRIPPVLSKDIIWAIEHVRKYPEPGRDDHDKSREGSESEHDGWELVESTHKDLLSFI